MVALMPFDSILVQCESIFLDMKKVSDMLPTNNTP
jgi:hypothetical protein